LAELIEQVAAAEGRTAIGVVGELFHDRVPPDVASGIG
jgi:hypothetical protein